MNNQADKQTNKQMDGWINKKIKKLMHVYNEHAKNKTQ